MKEVKKEDEIKWPLYTGTGKPRKNGNVPQKFPPPPPWRDFQNKVKRGETYKADEAEINIVNAALYLRRPILITGNPGTGKSSLAYSVANELGLGAVLRWNITSRTTLKDGLYSYDASSRFQATDFNDKTTNKEVNIGDYIRLGPLGTAFCRTATGNPRVLLIDEIDKSDIDLPNDLLHIFEEGEFLIPELFRLRDETLEVNIFSADIDNIDNIDNKVPVTKGTISCDQFPFVILTSNGEREFPPAFLRRCLRLNLSLPPREKLVQIVSAHLSEFSIHPEQEPVKQIIDEFESRRKHGLLATDQLLNAVFLVSQVQDIRNNEKLKKQMVDVVLELLSNSDLSNIESEE